MFATNGRLGTGSFNAILHEIGHAVDYNNRHASGRKAFQDAWTAESGSLNGYYHPTVSNGSIPANPSGYLEEIYAESFARFSGGDTAYEAAHPSFDSYWKTRKW